MLRAADEAGFDALDDRSEMGTQFRIGTERRVADRNRQSVQAGHYMRLVIQPNFQSICYLANMCDGTSPLRSARKRSRLLIFNDSLFDSL
jgi:hypothetical protein